MALSLAVTHKEDRLAHRVVEGVITFDSSYPTSGETITGLSDYLERADHIEFLDNSLRYVPVWDPATQKVLVKEAFHDYTASVDPASAATDAIANLDVTVTGVTTADTITLIPAVDLEAGVVPISAYAQAANTVRVRIANPTAGTVNGAAKTWTFRASLTTGALREVPAATDLSTDLAAVRFRAYGH